MNARMSLGRFACSLFACFVLLFVCATVSLGQTASTGALNGTVTDPSGAVIAGATVTLTSATGEVRTATTDASGSFKFSLLQPGTYSVKFSAAGFKTASVPAVTVNVTETAVLNRNLEVGAQTEQITVQATAEQLQTQNATNGGTVSGQEITSLPLVSRNYTQVISLSPGVVANASTASSVGNGTQDVSANGSTANENNYSMDGVSVVNYVSGMAAQEGSFPGIPIPNPDAIQEFKVQTSQYDASSGRNPGANVEVVTKTGTNSFHGAAWEFNRNNFFNANDFYYKHSELSPGGSGVNTPQILKQNTFGFTLGGPIMKDKLFFFGSYQGLRQINGIGTTGFASGYESNTWLLPWNDYADKASGVCSDLRCTNNVPAYKAYLGQTFGGQQGFFPGSFGGTFTEVMPCMTGDATCNTTNITNTAVGLLQAKGAVKGGFNQGFYFPSAPQSCGALPCLQAISDPFFAREDQFMINTQYVLSGKHTLYERYMYQKDPEFEPFNCFFFAGNCNPGAPTDAFYGNHIGSLEWQWIVNPNVVNQARFAFRRDIENNTDPNQPLQACSLPNGASIIPMVYNGAACGSISTPALAKQFPELLVPPMLDIFGVPNGPACNTPNVCVPWSQGGNFSMISSNFINTFIASDSLSWNLGKHSLRFGFEGTRIQYNNTIPASGRGEITMWSTADFLTSSSGPAIDGTPATPDGGFFAIGGGAFEFGLKGPLTHYNRANEFALYAQDDFKVNSRLTLNLGVRWEYSGFPDDVSGQFTDVWETQLTKLNTGSALNALGPTGTLVGFVVPTNFDKKDFGLTAPTGATGVVSSGTKTLLPGSPLNEFAPRIGLAWEPFGGNKFVVRAGYGWFYDTIYANLLIDNQLNLPPYSGAGSGPAPQNQSNTLHDPWAAGALVPLAWTPRYMYTNPGGVTSLCPAGVCSSGFGYTSDSPVMGSRLPLVQEYNLDLQYEFTHGWVADIGYVGSHGIHLYDWSRDINVAQLVPGGPNNPTLARGSGAQNVEMIASSLPYNDSGNPNQITASTLGIAGPNDSNINERVSYLGFTPGGVASTSTLGDSLYNSLQAQLRHQFGHGLLLNVSYTWSKNFTNINTNAAGTGIQPPGEVVFGAANSNSPLDLKQQYGLASFNRSQRVVISYVYNFPSFNNARGFEGKLLSGWAVSGVTTIQNGLPFWVTDANLGSIYGAGTSRAALVDPTVCSARTGNCKSGIPLVTSGSTTERAMPGNSWINASAFLTTCTTTCTPGQTPLPANSPYCIGGTFNPLGSSSAPCGTAGSTFPDAGLGYGNEGIGAISGPGQFDFDTSLLKSTKVTEWGTLEFHFDAFNVFNHPQFNNPLNLAVSTPAQFGAITSTSVTPRVLQLGLKFLF
jgi:Carboxypeptidase regulatory-like domain